MNSIMFNRTWEVVECPYKCKPVWCIWVSNERLVMMVLLKSTWQGLQPRVTPRKKMNIFLIFILLLHDWPHSSVIFLWQPLMVFSFIIWMLRQLF
jgi:hypothetical protein